jgi:hypothetical protein
MLQNLPKFLLIIILQQMRCVLKYRCINTYFRDFIDRTMRFYVVRYHGEPIRKHQIKIIRDARLYIKIRDLNHKIFKHITHINKINIYTHYHLILILNHKKITVDDLHYTASTCKLQELHTPTRLHICLQNIRVNVCNLNMVYESVTITNTVNLPLLHFLDFRVLKIKNLKSDFICCELPIHIQRLILRGKNSDLKCIIPNGMYVGELNCDHINRKIKKRVKVLKP